MQLEITMNEKQIKEACLEFTREKFHSLKMQFEIKSYDIDENSMITLKIVGEELG